MNEPCPEAGALAEVEAPDPPGPGTVCDAGLEEPAAAGEADDPAVWPVAEPAAPAPEADPLAEPDELGATVDPAPDELAPELAEEPGAIVAPDPVPDPPGTMAGEPDVVDPEPVARGRSADGAVVACCAQAGAASAVATRQAAMCRFSMCFSWGTIANGSQRGLNRLVPPSLNDLHADGGPPSASPAFGKAGASAAARTVSAWG
jgi:hypothetical protein